MGAGPRRRRRARRCSVIREINLHGDELREYAEAAGFEAQPNEIYEWWLVTDWLRDKLRAYEEPILDNDYGMWWGRCTTGQSIKIDYIMERIARDVLKVFAEYK